MYKILFIFASLICLITNVMHIIVHDMIHSIAIRYKTIAHISIKQVACCALHFTNSDFTRISIFVFRSGNKFQILGIS